MNANPFLKKSVQLFTMLLLSNMLIAQDRITCAGQSTHRAHGTTIDHGYFYIRATDGGQFTIDWGDGSPMEAQTGLGDTNIFLDHSYRNGYDTCIITITASDTLCKFTYLDFHSYWCDDVPGFQICSLTLEECADLAYLDCRRNALPLSDLYAAHLAISDQGGKRFIGICCGRLSFVGRWASGKNCKAINMALPNAFEIKICIKGNRCS